MILALAGGVGGAKLAAGLAAALPPEDLAIVVNTGDDFEHLGLSISPDIDSVVYALAGMADPVRGWGVANESWAFMDALREVGGETWFQLGDRDLATHVERTRQLREGSTLSDVTTAISRALGIRHRVIPMSDRPAPTLVETDQGQLAFQDYFVRRQCAPKVLGFAYGGGMPSQAFDALLDDARLDGIIICPSNPYLSIDPILALTDVRRRVGARNIPVIAVSPIVGGTVVKGPAAKIMAELGMVPSSLSVAMHYGELIDGIVIDIADSPQGLQLPCPFLATATLMKSENDKRRLAQEVVGWVRQNH